MLIENNSEILAAYLHICEGKRDLKSKLNIWYNQYKPFIEDDKKAVDTIAKISELDESEEDNVLVMDKITEQFLILSKQIQNDEDDKVKNSLAKILQNLK